MMSKTGLSRKRAMLRRITAERDDVDQKLGRLEDMLYKHNEFPHGLPRDVSQEQFDLMNEQQSYMTSYWDTLKRRVDALTAEIAKEDAPDGNDTTE